MTLTGQPSLIFAIDTSFVSSNIILHWWRIFLIKMMWLNLMVYDKKKHCQQNLRDKEI